METADSTSFAGPSLQHPRNAHRGFLWHEEKSEFGDVEDSAYAPRRLSSPSFKERLIALWQLIAHFRQRAVVENWGYGGEQKVRDRMNLPCLVQAGRHAGRSRVVYKGSNITIHLWLRDYFISIVQNKTRVLIVAFLLIFQVVFFFWGAIYYLIVRYQPGCIYGADSFVEAWLFAVVTQLTIGYGNTGPQKCWLVSWMIVIQGILAVLLSSIVVGIMFARISYPHYRGKSIYIGDRAIVARRDGTLKLMFRIADVRATQVVEPHVKAFLYTWGAGRVTAEGERIPVRCEGLDIGYIDGMMLLPITIEHTIDERSPLCGHTHDSLTGLSAEIVVTFEGTTEFGNPFMARRSYLPHEIHWGEQFLPIIMKPDPTARDKRYGVDLTHFHQLRRQNDVPAAPRSETSQFVVTRALKAVPYPLLGENTLVVSDSLCISYAGPGKLQLSARIGDTYPNQMTEITVYFILYRWRSLSELEADPLLPPFVQHRLDVGYDTGADRVNLRLPLEIKHVIDAQSPLADWLKPGGVDADLNSEIVVLVNAYVTRTSANMLRQRTYIVGQHVRWGYRFQPMVKPPAYTSDGKPRVRWGKFHLVAQDARKEVQGHAVEIPGGKPCARLSKQARQGEEGMVRAPESHAPRRAQISHEQNTEEERRLTRELSRALSQHLAAVSPRAGSSSVEQSDYTIMPMDLQRYATQIANQTLMPQRSRRPGLGRLNSLFSHVLSSPDSSQSTSSIKGSVPTRTRGSSSLHDVSKTTDNAGRQALIARESPFAASGAAAVSATTVTSPTETSAEQRPPVLRATAASPVSIPGGASRTVSEDGTSSPTETMMFLVSPESPAPTEAGRSRLSNQESATAGTVHHQQPPMIVGSAADTTIEGSVGGTLHHHARSPSLDVVPEDEELTLYQMGPHASPKPDLPQKGDDAAAAALARQLNKSSASSSWQQSRALSNLFGGDDTNNDASSSSSKPQ